MVDVLATGYPSLDFILPVSHSPKTGETALMDAVPIEHEATFGGCGANVAAALANLGFRAAVATIIGGDREGYLYTSQLRRMGIDMQDVIKVPDAKTSRSYLFRNPDGEYQNFFFAGAADAWKGRLRLMNVRRVKYALLTVGPYYYNKQFVDEVKRADKPLIWQLKPDISAYTQEAMKEFAEASEYILMNHIEAEFIKEGLKLDSVADLLKKKAKAVVVTKGEEGATLYDEAGVFDVKAVPPSNVEDPTGAGDAFTAGFIAGLLKDYGYRKSAQIGAVMASFVLERVGCQTNLPKWETMQARYEEHFGAL